MNGINFSSNMSLPIHRWFRYSAGFSAEWVESIVKAAGDPGKVRVLDPFAGSGTTLLVAQQAGAESLGLDSHPFVARVAKAKLNWTANSAELLTRSTQVVQNFTPTLNLGTVPRLLDSCYTETALRDLIGLRDSVAASVKGDEIDQLLWLAFVSIIRSVSHVGTAQWQYVLPNKRKRTSAIALQAFVMQVQMMADDISWRQIENPAPAQATYVEADARERASYPSDWATHVICSPPYANNYDYADATRLEQTVLGEVQNWGELKAVRQNLLRSCSQHMSGYDPTEDINDPILAPIVNELYAAYSALSVERKRHGGKKAYHHMIVAYFHDLARVLINLRGASKDTTEVYFVIGDSAPYGVHIPVERWLGELATKSGFDAWSFEKVRDRNIKWKNRKHTVPLHEGILRIN